MASPSVCPVPILCLNELTISSDFLTVWYGQYSSFPNPTAVNKFQGNTLSGGVKYTVGKFCKYHPLSRKRYEIGPWLLWNTSRMSWVADRSVSVLMILSDLERRDARGQFFSDRICVTTLYDLTL